MSNEERLTGLDSSFLHLEQGPAHMHVGSTMLFEGTSVVHEMVALVESFTTAVGPVRMFGPWTCRMTSEAKRGRIS